MRCLQCGLEQPSGHRFCEECGARLTAADGFCSRCGFEHGGAGRGRVELAPAAHLAGVSDPGAVRDHNEDFLALAADPGGDMLVVCDGVSNSQHPDVAAAAAASAACDALRAALRAGGPPEQNQFLAPGADRIHAVVSVAASPSEADVRSRPLAEALLSDCSASMGGEKSRYAKAAVERTIDLLEEDAWFRVIAGMEPAWKPPR
jgi:hypothetical protein